MTRWGTPAEYAWLYKASLTDQYRNMLKAWLETENPHLHQLVLKELGRGKAKGHNGAADAADGEAA